MDQSEALTEVAFIKKAIADSRQATFEYGVLLIFWGIVTVIGMCCTLLVVNWPDEVRNIFGIDHDLFFYIWVVWAIVVGLFSAQYLIRKYRESGSLTYMGKIIVSTWISCGILFVLISHIGSITGAIRIWALSPIGASIFGMGFFLSGVISRQIWCRNLGFCWWAGALFFFWLGDNGSIWELYIMVLMIVFLFIVPGVVVFANEKKSGRPAGKIQI